MPVTSLEHRAAQHPPRVRFSEWLLPSLALTAACVTLFYCLFLFRGYQQLFRDSDAGWHIVNGETILSTRHLPRTDPYSFSRPGREWFAWEWGADVLTAALQRAGGLRAVALFYAAAIAAGVWMWFRLHWAMGGNFLVAAAMAPLLLSTCSIHWLARPHVFGWLFLLGAVWGAERLRPVRPAHAAAVAVFLAAWANIHGSFFLGILVAAVYFWKRAPWMVAVAAAAPLANPYGWRLYRHLFGYLTDSALLSRIGEYQSFDFHSPGAAQVGAALMLAIAGGTLALLVGRFAHFVLAVLFSAMALRSARALPLAALLLLPVANAAITETLRRRGILDGLLAYGTRLHAIDLRMRGGMWAAAALAAAFLALRTLPAGFPPEAFPVMAYPSIPERARLFAPDKFGGYLIYRSRGARKVFFDGRSDFYGTEFLERYGRLVQVRPGWKEYFDSWGFTHALLPNDAPLLAALKQAGWQPVYRDAVVTLLAPAASISTPPPSEPAAPAPAAWVPAAHPPARVLPGLPGNFAAILVLQQNIGRLELAEVPAFLACAGAEAES